jgi:curved DNA-binding protein CbpA
MTLYDDLGVAPDATEAEIAAAYRSAARKHHPDAGGNAADFDRMQRAANILRDPVKRAEYDRTGSVDDSAVNAQSQAIEILCGAFSEAISRCENFAAVDIVKNVRSALVQQLQHIVSQRQDVALKRDRLEDAIGRLTHSGDQPDFVRNMLVRQLRAYDARVADMDRMTASIETAIEMAQAYAWQGEPDTEAAMKEIALEAISWDDTMR